MDLSEKIQWIQLVFGGRRFLFNDEKDLQAKIKAVFDSSRIFYVREHRFTKEDIIDFIVEGNVGVEIKIKGSKSEIYKQVVRYLQHPEIDAIIVVTNKAIVLPREINGKQVRVISLGKAWL